MAIAFCETVHIVVKAASLVFLVFILNVGSFNSFYNSYLDGVAR